MSKSSKKFPLTAASNGQYRKIIRGKTIYFGSVKDPAAALRRYYDYIDRINAEVIAPERPEPEPKPKPKPEPKPKPKPKPEPTAFIMPAESQPNVWTVEAAAIAYFKARQRDVDNGRLSPVRFADYLRNITEFVQLVGYDKPLAAVTAFDYTAVAIRFSEIYTTGRAATKITFIRAFIRWAVNYDILVTMPKFGTDFVVRKDQPAAADRSDKVLSREDVLQLLGARPSAQWRAIILLGINCAFGNEDIAQLRLENVDLDTLWIDYPRPKTGLARYAVLWPETAAAIRDYMKKERPKLRPKMEDKGRLFATRNGKPWAYDMPKKEGGAIRMDSLGRLVSRATKNPDRVSFYSLRHTFRTVADRALDRPAIEKIMGHALQGMDKYYMGEIDRDRIERVCNVVHDWLFPPESGKENEGGK